MGSAQQAGGGSRLDAGLSQVERVGETIHRTSGPWTADVHALLHHLRRVGFEGAPRPVGMDSAGREILTFVPGEGASHSDEELADVGTLIRAFHDSSESFETRPDAKWQFMVGAPTRGDVVCHNDLSPDNTIYAGDQTARAFIDWDLAAPAPRIWDLAWAAYRFIPLYDDATCEQLGYPIPSRTARLRILCAAYGLDSRAELLPTVSRRIRVLYDTARSWGGAGRPGWREVWHGTRGEQWLRGLRYVEAERGNWERELLGG